MTVKELKEQLKGLPDGAKVYHVYDDRLSPVDIIYLARSGNVLASERENLPASADAALKSFSFWKHLPPESKDSRYLANPCPICGQKLYAYYDTPTCDEPELGCWFVECSKCEYKDDDSYPNLECLNRNFTVSDSEET